MRWSRPLIPLALGLLLAATLQAPATADQTGELVRRMTLEEKVGQLFVTFVLGDRADTTDPRVVAVNRFLYGVDNGAQLVARYHPGGIIYIPPNLGNPRQIAELSNGLQRAALAQRVPVPLQISVDHEGGLRATGAATPRPGNMGLGATRSTRAAYEDARLAGAELRAMGINQNNAPVLDVNVQPANPIIGVRSYSDRTSLVSALGSAQIRGYRASGSITTVKHFPGHGNTDVDSHVAIPVIDQPLGAWRRTDLPPFAAAIRQGADSVMLAHIVAPALDPAGDLATVSRPIITGLLRDRLGFDGVVTTDGLDLQAVRDKYPDERVPVLALRAGADQLLMPPAGKFAAQYDAVVAAVRSGELTERRIDRSVTRILKLKRRHGLFTAPYVDPGAAEATVGAPRNLADEQRITDATTTLVGDAGRLLPLSKDHRSILVTGATVIPPPPPGEPGPLLTGLLADAIARRGPAVTGLPVTVTPGQAEIDAAVAAARRRDLTVVTTADAWNTARHGPGQLDLVRALLATGKPVIVVAVWDPYDLGKVGAPTRLATYAANTGTFEALAKVLFGETTARGRLPVPVP